MSESIKAYRDTFNLNVRIGFREDIIKTVTDLGLWKTVLTEWKEKKWSPFKINWMLSEYERREKSAERSNGSLSGEQAANGKALPVGISQWSNSEVLEVRRPMETESQASSREISEILSKALRTTDRP